MKFDSACNSPNTDLVKTSHSQVTCADGCLCDDCCTEDNLLNLNPADNLFNPNIVEKFAHGNTPDDCFERLVSDLC